MTKAEQEHIAWLEQMVKAYCDEMNASDSLTVYTKTTYTSQAAKFAGWVKRRLAA